MITHEKRILADAVSETRIAEPPAGSDSPGIIVGYAAVFYREDDPTTEYEMRVRTKGGGERRIIERVSRGAFEGSIDRNVTCKFNHRDEMILGRNQAGTLEIEIDDVGLRYRCQLPNTTTGRDVAVSVGRGDVFGSSFDFVKREHRFEQTDGALVRWLDVVDLFEVGPVTEPAYEGTSVAAHATRSLTEHVDQYLAEQIAAEERQAHRRAARRRIRRNQAHRNREK